MEDYETWGVEQAAAYLKIHRDTVCELARLGTIPACKNGRAWVFMPHLLRAHRRKTRERRIGWRTLRWATDAVSAFYNGEKTPSRPPRLHREAMLLAMPAWANREKIQEFYREARQRTADAGIRYTVDHIIPLRGEQVCGLHVENNLQIITLTDNSAKCNRFECS